MMLLLFGDISPHIILRRRAHSENGVSILPVEVLFTHCFGNPDRRCFFQIPHKIREAMGGFERNEQMDMILDSSHTQRDSVEAMDSATQIFMQSRQKISP